MYYNMPGGAYLSLPPHFSISVSGVLQRVKYYSFRTQSYDIIKQIESFLAIKNQFFSIGTASNIEGRLIGDYTCYFEDENGVTYKAIIVLNSNENVDTRFWKDGVYQNKARDFTLDISEVE